MGANIINAIQNLKMAQEQFDDFRRQYPDSKGDKMFKLYGDKITWMFKDIITHPFITEDVRDGIKHEIASDVYAVPAILEKIALLNPEQRELIEDTLDAMLAGEKEIIDKKEITNKKRIGNSISFIRRQVALLEFIRRATR